MRGLLTRCLIVVSFVMLMFALSAIGSSRMGSGEVNECIENR